MWGISTTGAAYSGSGTLRFQTQSFARAADSEETRDNDGEVINVTTYNQQQEIQLSVVPSGSTLAAAKTSNVVPVPGEVITVSDTDTSFGGGSTKTYMVVSATMSKGNTTKATIEITAKRWAGISTYTVLT